MLTQIIGKTLLFGFQGLVVLGMFHFLQSLWRDLIFIVSGKERL